MSRPEPRNRFVMRGLLEWLRDSNRRDRERKDENAIKAATLRRQRQEADKDRDAALPAPRVNTDWWYISP